MQKNIYKILRKQKMKVIFDVIFALLQHSQITHDKMIWFDNYLYCSYNGCGPYIVIYIHYSRSFLCRDKLCIQFMNHFIAPILCYYFLVYIWKIFVILSSSKEFKLKKRIYSIQWTIDIKMNNRYGRCILPNALYYDRNVQLPWVWLICIYT